MTDTSTPPQPSSWDENPYLLATTRILIVIGTSYLLRSLFQLIQYSLSLRTVSRTDQAAAEENIGMDLDENVSGSQMSLELDFGSLDDGDLGVRLPERGYHPRGRR